MCVKIDMGVFIALRNEVRSQNGSVVLKFFRRRVDGHRPEILLVFYTLEERIQMSFTEVIKKMDSSKYFSAFIT